MSSRKRRVGARAAFWAWTNLSECTFVLPATDRAADYRVRIFSVTTELPFAGHPTLGTARAWLDAGGVPRAPGRVVQECGVGLVPVRIVDSETDDDTRAFAAPPLIRSGPVADADLAVALSVLGVTPADVVAAEWIDNGPGWLGVLLKSADAVLALEPDLGPRAGQQSLGVVGLHGATADAAIDVRAFFNDGGGPLREDPATGTLDWRVGNRDRQRSRRELGLSIVPARSPVSISNDFSCDAPGIASRLALMRY